MRIVARQVVARSSLLALPLGVLVLLAASCGGESRTETAAADEAAPATSSASTTAPAETAQAVGDTTASCADPLRPESVESIACAWIADADPAACESMSDRLLSTLFGRQGTAGIEGCRELLGGVRAADDKALVSFEKPLLEGERATLAMSDEARSPRLRYTFTFVRRGGRWLIDTSEHAGAAPDGRADEPPVPAGDAAAAGEIRELVELWYAQAEPAVCEFMTAEMLEFGWGETGTRGRELCRTAVAKADPLANVRVRRPLVNGDTAEVEVVYALGGDRQFDRIGLVRRNGEWLVDSVLLAGFVSE